MMPEEYPVIVVPYDPAWAVLFRTIATPIRETLGDIALRIDHVGSTSVEGLAAKPVIDIQISVDDFEPFAPIHDPLISLGYIWRDDNPDQSRRYFREPADSPTRIHIHVRRYGRFGEQLNLLFRDYLRTHPEDRDRYAALKYELAEKFRDDRTAYVKGKDSLIWEIVRRAYDWSYYEGWVLGASDM